MGARQHREAVRADLVRDVTVARDAIRPDDDRVDLSLREEVTCHAVGQQLDRYVVARQLPRRQPRALQVRPRLVGEHQTELAQRRGCTDDTERGADAAGRERARVAVGQHASAIGQQRRAELAHRDACGDIVAVQLPRGVERLLERRRAGDRDHALDGPAQVDRGRSRGRKLGRRRVDVSVPLREHDAVRSRDADRGRAADDHVADRSRDVERAGRDDVDLFVREAALVEEVHFGAIDRDLGRRVARPGERVRNGQHCELSQETATLPHMPATLAAACAPPATARGVRSSMCVTRGSVCVTSSNVCVTLARFTDSPRSDSTVTCASRLSLVVWPSLRC